MKNNNTLLGKRVRGTNAYGEPVGEPCTVIAVYPADGDRYGNYPIVVQRADGSQKTTRSFWVKIVTNE